MDVCVTVRGWAQKSWGSSLPPHTITHKQTHTTMTGHGLLEAPGLRGRPITQLLPMMKNRTPELSHTQANTYPERQLSSVCEHGYPAASRNYCWLSGTLPQPVTGDCSISSLWRSGQLSERETYLLGNSSPSISTLRGAGCAIPERDMSGFKRVCTLREFI